VSIADLACQRDQARAQARDLLRGMRLGVIGEEKARKLARHYAARDDCRLLHGTGAQRMAAAHAHKGPTRGSRQPKLCRLARQAHTHQPRDCFNRFARLSKTAPSRANQGFIILRALLNFARNRYRTKRRAADGREPGGCPQAQLASRNAKSDGSLTPASVLCGVCLPVSTGGQRGYAHAHGSGLCASSSS